MKIKTQTINNVLILFLMLAIVIILNFKIKDGSLINSPVEIGPVIFIFCVFGLLIAFFKYKSSNRKKRKSS